MKKYVMTDEKKHDLRELKITVIVLLSVAFVLGMVNWVCYLVDSTYAKELPLGEYLAYYPSRNLTAYKETIKEFSVPTLKDIKKEFKEKEITDRYNTYLESAMRMYKFEYGAELDPESEVFLTKYVSDTGIGGYYGVIGRIYFEFNDDELRDYQSSYVKAQVIIPDVTVSTESVNFAVKNATKKDRETISTKLRQLIGIGLPQVSGKEDTTYVCLVLRDGVVELGFNEMGEMISQKQLVGDYSKSSVSQNIGILVDLRNEAFADE